MADIWHLNTDDGSQGPYSREQLIEWLLSGEITEDWYLWREGFGDWQTIGSTMEFQGWQSVVETASPEPEPEPEQKAVVLEPSVTTVEDVSERPRALAPTSKSSFSGFLKIAVVLLLLAGGFFYLYPPRFFGENSTQLVQLEQIFLSRHELLPP